MDVQFRTSGPASSSRPPLTLTFSPRTPPLRPQQGPCGLCGSVDTRPARHPREEALAT